MAVATPRPAVGCSGRRDCDEETTLPLVAPEFGFERTGDGGAFGQRRRIDSAIFHHFPLFVVDGRIDLVLHTPGLFRELAHGN